MRTIRNIITFFHKKTYRVISASEVQDRDVTSGLKNRTEINGRTVVTVGNRAMIYTQQLIVKRKEVVKSITHYVRVKKVKSKVGKQVLIQAVLKQKRKGDLIRL